MKISFSRFFEARRYFAGCKSLRRPSRKFIILFSFDVFSGTWRLVRPKVPTSQRSRSTVGARVVGSRDRRKSTTQALCSAGSRTTDATVPAENLIFPDFFRAAILPDNALREHVRGDGRKFEADCAQLDETAPWKIPRDY